MFMWKMETAKPNSRSKNEIILVYNHGLKAKDIRLAQSVLEENKENFIREWKNRFDHEN